MGPASLLAVSFALLALYVAAFNAWLYVQRRSEAAHLWLAVAAVGIAIVSAGQAVGYGAETVREAELWQRIELAGAGPLIVGFLRFSFHFLGVRRPRLDRAGLWIAGLGMFFALATPWVFDGVARERNVAWLDQRVIESGLDPLGYAFFASYVPLFGAVASLYVKYLPTLEDRTTPLLIALCIWWACSMNDLAIGASLYQGPYLMSAGYAAFIVAFSAVLIRRFVHSMAEVERSAGALQQRIEERTEELRQKDLQLAHGERMATLGTLASSVAHEINNPTAYVTSNLNHLEQMIDVQDELPRDELREIVGECQEGVERIRTIVNDLLSLARRSDGEDQDVDLVSLVESTLPLVRNEARYRVELVTELRPVPAVRGDPRLLGQVVLQLMLNGIQAAADGKARAPRVVVETSFDDGSVWLLVRDNGRGIPEQDLPHLFDPLYGTRAQGARGFGLAVTHQIVGRHRGRIDVQSSGLGTAMVVELPIAETPPAATDDETD